MGSLSFTSFYSRLTWHEHYVMSKPLRLRTPPVSSNSITNTAPRGEEGDYYCCCCLLTFIYRVVRRESISWRCLHLRSSLGVRTFGSIHIVGELLPAATFIHLASSFCSCNGDQSVSILFDTAHQFFRLPHFLQTQILLYYISHTEVIKSLSSESIACTPK